MHGRLITQTVAVVFYVACICFFVSREHYSLPTPKDYNFDPATGEAVFNEQNALQLVKELSSAESELGIHYRIVGTHELVAAEDHLLSKLYSIKEQLDKSELSKTVSVSHRDRDRCC